ncbi:DUF1353 domain-containing protein [Campylobacter majalis]|uniref:DUF1353 domain-containing protein n=1 Tax=Campylobacter majalis TaxID=2790656 RepID=UPI003D686493
MVKLLTAHIAKLFTKKVLDKNTSEIVKIARPILKPYNKDKFELVQDYTHNGITIKAGYKTNGADIPRLFWCIFPPNSPEYLSAVVVHDYLCDEAEKIYKLGFKPKAREKFKFADEILQEMMLNLGCNRLKVSCFYYACRAWHKIRY